MMPQRNSTFFGLFVVAQQAAPLFLFVLSIGLSSCAVFRIAKDPKKDYVFSVTGVVRTQDGAPLVGADVTLNLNGPVYEGIDLVRSRQVLTAENGGFAFAYLSHEWGVRYTITARKEGFEPQTFSGAAPPSARHAVKLKRAGEPAKTDGSGSESSYCSLATARYALVGVSQ